ncbi:MAG: ABC transporter permease [Dehalococcoidia bacterium]|nr:ABC transporter permease [Dehalococcoidia bacterium]
MKKTLTVIRHEFRRMMKNKPFILLTLAVPLLAILGYTVYESIQGRHGPVEPVVVELGYVDGTGIFREFTAQEGVVLVQYPDETVAREALLSGEVRDYFVIPADYLDTGAIVRYTTTKDVQAPYPTRQAIEHFLLSNLLAGDVDPAVLERVKALVSLESIRLDENGEIIPVQDELNRFMVPMVFALLFVFALFMSSGYLFQSVAEEKENRVIEILLSSVTSGQLLAGKVIGLGAAGLVQITVWLMTAWFLIKTLSLNVPGLSQLSVPLPVLAWGIIYFVLGFLLFGALYAGVGSLFATPREGQGWSTLFTLPAVLPIWLSSVIMSSPDGVVARVLTFIPITSPVTSIMRVSGQAMAGWEIAVSLLVLVGSVLLTMWIAAKMLRVFYFMYGKRPAFSEVYRYLREA